MARATILSGSYMFFGQHAAGPPTSSFADIRLETRRPSEEAFVGSSIQFLLPNFDTAAVRDVVKCCRALGVELMWFGAADPVGYTSRHQSWHCMDHQSLPASDRILDHLCDMRLPLTFSVDDCSLIGTIVGECVNDVRADLDMGSLAPGRIFELDAS
jgi:hypothetical protein